MQKSFEQIFIFIILTIFKISVSNLATTTLLNFTENDNIGNSITSDAKIDYRRKYAQQMLSYMNLSVSPCEDFYEYACGNWKNLIEKRYTHEKRHSVFDLKFKFDDFVENILQRTNINDLTPEYAEEFELSKKFYNNCIESELYPMQKSKEYLNILNEIGGFPAINSSWDSNNFSWLNMSFHMTNYGVDGLMTEELSLKFPFPPYADIPDFGIGLDLDYNHLIDSNTSFAYEVNYKNMHDILTLYDVDKTRIAGIINEIFEFLNAVMKVIKEFNKDYDECHRLKTKFTDSEIDEVLRLWQAYYEISWKNVDLFVKIEPCIYFYRHLIDICNRHKEAVANYLSIKFLHQMDARLTDKTLQKGYCVYEIRKSMQYLFDNLYFKINYDIETIDEVTLISKKLRQSLQSLIQEIDWIDESTRNEALKKVESIKEYIGQQENKNLTDKRIREIRKLKYSNEGYAANNLNLKKFQQQTERYLTIHYKELSNDTEQNIYAMEANAYFDIRKHVMVFFYGVIQPPVFNKNWPNSLKFGAIGQFISHEFAHGFETNEFLPPERSNCFVDQHSQYYIPEINLYIKGNQTKNENIADANGLVLAMKAYRQYINESTNNFGPSSRIYMEEQMPGLHLTPEQLFFLAYAQMLCASHNKADYWKDITFGTHSIDRYRVVGPLSHNKDFSKAYNCEVGKKMNPSVQKCKLW